MLDIDAIFENFQELLDNYNVVNINTIKTKARIEIIDEDNKPIIKTVKGFKQKDKDFRQDIKENINLSDTIYKIYFKYDEYLLNNKNYYLENIIDNNKYRIIDKFNYKDYILLIITEMI